LGERERGFLKNTSLKSDIMFCLFCVSDFGFSKL